MRSRLGENPGIGAQELLSRALLTYERAWTLLPVACLVGLVGALVASPLVLSQELGSPVPLGSFHRLEGYLVAGLVVAVIGGLLAAGWDRIPRHHLLRAVMVVVAVDLVIYSANQHWLTAPPRSASPGMSTFRMRMMAMVAPESTQSQCSAAL